MTNDENPKRYDLEERTFQFAKAGRAFVKRLPRTISNVEDVRQFVRGSGSIGANYIEANEAIGGEIDSRRFGKGEIRNLGFC